MIIDAYNEGWQYGFLSGGDSPKVLTKNSDQYYNEHFKQ